VDEAVRTADVDECAIAGDSGDGALHRAPGLQPAEKLLALARAVLVLRRLLADDQPVPLAVDLEDLDRDALADQRLEAAGIGTRHLARRQEATQAEDVDDQTTLVLLAHVGVDHGSVGLLLRGHDPGRLGTRAAQAEDDVAFLVLGLKDVDLDLVAGLELGIHVSAQSELLARDDAFGLGPDVDEDLVRVDSYDDPIHDVPVVGGFEGLLLEVEVVLHGHRCG